MKPKMFLTTVVVVAFLCSAPATHATFAQSNPFLSSQIGYPNWSPFTGIKWENDRPIVQIRKKWYDLVSIHGVSTDDILKKCQKEGWQTRKRVAEDLVQILRLMGHKVEKTTDLVLRDKDGKIVMMKNVVMTDENRRQLSRPRIDDLPAPASTNPFLSSVRGYPKWSAFTGVKWKGNQPFVEVDGEWYELLRFHGIPIDEIREACEKNHWPYKHRFTEDLVQIVRLMGHEIEKTTDLALRNESGKVVIRK